MDRRCLVVEDEWLVAMMLEDVLDELGYEVIGPVGSVKQALAIIEVADGDLDGAVLDMNLGSEYAYPVAEALLFCGIPFVFVTAYRPEELDPRFRHVPVVQKPYTKAQLADALAATFRCAPSERRAMQPPASHGAPRF